MRHDVSESDIIGTRPRRTMDDLPLFSQPAPTRHPADFADLAASTDTAEQLLILAERCATAILAVQGSFTVAEVRMAMEKLGLIENAGKEKLDALGALGRRMGCKVIGRERAPASLAVAHGNLISRWARA